MKRAVGIFLIVQSLLTYFIMDALYTPFKVTDEIIDTDMKTGVTTVSYESPGGIHLIYVIPMITFILGIYFILTSKKKRRLKTRHFYN
ncbi:hypothetical protein [Priestia endophytica]|uniref:hypothetical protein n=1 Tax=Priestia endophytica TaxID=135735 RepID=UPI000DCA33D2|nr:hypothetical protein [Priestia endophytica]RAS77473.1 hypothetical protein A4R27_18700 [Priestia endophytica]RAS90822.1 hypothetical protein A3863_07505 [Priestia endophytica]